MFGFTAEQFFETDEEGRAEVSVDFSREPTPPPAPPAGDVSGGGSATGQSGTPG
jgi:hypothetical protein